MKYILLALVAIGLSGCGDESTTVTETINSIQCGDGGCGDVIIGDGSGLHTGTEPDDEASIYDARLFEEGLTQTECNDLGFFYCIIEQECLNQPSTGGTCTANQ